MVNTFDTSIITIKKYSSRRGLNSPSFTSPRFIKSSWTSSSDGGYSVFSDNDDRDDDNIQGLVLSTSCSGSLSDADIDDNISVDNRSLLSEVRDYGPIDVDTCRKASKKDKMKKKVEVNFFEYTSPKNKGSSGRRTSFIKKELTSLKALSTKTRLSLSRGFSTDTESSGSSQSDSGGCFA